ncbi:MAG: hypothetical protein HYT87_18985 [Nitrospirae bacterium]|nr:hypothetical protein [Nitrospirota bacterium]
MWNKINVKDNLNLPDWFILYSLCLDFQPDLILELGRGHGNSTCVLTEAANRLPGARVVSLCWSRDWFKKTLPLLQPIRPASWFDRLETRVEDVSKSDWRKVMDGSRRVFLFWDVHGVALAENLISRIFPVLAERESMVVVDDLVDLRYSPGRAGMFMNGNSGERCYCLGPFASLFSEILPLYDFASRNQIELHSARHEWEMSGSSEWFKELTAPHDPHEEIRGEPPATFAYFEFHGGRGGRHRPVFPPATPWTLMDEIRSKSPQRLLIFGAGEAGRQTHRAIQDGGAVIEAFVDNDKGKWQQQIEGKPVLAPSQLKEFSPSNTVVVIASYFQGQILSQVRQDGWPLHAIILADPVQPPCVSCVEKNVRRVA